MINKQDVIAFFDARAEKWDETLQHNDEIINRILDHAEVNEGKEVLDVACGTGVLFEDYLKRNVASVKAIDISSKMCEMARKKVTDSRIEVICADVEMLNEDRKYDVIIVYNAFPHFSDPVKLIAKCASLLKENGRFTIAHGLSRAKIDAHHQGTALAISNGLMHENELAKLFEPYFNVDVIISNNQMYQVAGTRK